MWIVLGVWQKERELQENDRVSILTILERVSAKYMMKREVFKEKIQV